MAAVETPRIFGLAGKVSVVDGNIQIGSDASRLLTPDAALAHGLALIEAAFQASAASQSKAE